MRKVVREEERCDNDDHVLLGCITEATAEHLQGTQADHKGGQAATR